MEVKASREKCELTHCSASLLFMHRARAFHFNSELYCKLSFHVGYDYFSSQQHHCVSVLKIIRILYYSAGEFIVINNEFLFYLVAWR